MTPPDSLIRSALFESHAGVILLDEQQRIVFWNRWMVRHSGTSTETACGETLHALYPTANIARLIQRVVAAIDAGQTSLLSNSLNRTPLPLFADPTDPTALPIEQMIVVKPLIADDGKRFAFIKIDNVTTATARENLLKEQSEQLRRLAERHQRGEVTARAVIDNVSDALVTIDRDNNIVDLNKAAHRLFMYEDEVILGQPFRLLLAPTVSDDCVVRGDCEDTEVNCVNAEGKVFSAEVTASRIVGDEREHTIVLIRDQTERKQYEEAIFEEKEFAQVTLQAIKEAVITTDQSGTVNGSNAAAAALLGVPEERMYGSSLAGLLFIDDSEHCQQAEHAIEAALVNGISTELEESSELQLDDGRVIKIAGCVTPMRGKDGSIIGSVTVLQDVSAERHMQEILSYQASHDELTELINRREFERRLEQVVSHSDSKPRSVLLFLDLDQFKLVNDTCGHRAGDQLLRQLTSIMKLQVRQSDTFARLGGDEFAVLLPGCDVDVGLRIANALRDEVKQFRFHWNEASYGVGVSIGLVIIDETWTRIGEVMSAADSACYMAKENGRDQVVVYQPAGDKETQRRGEISQAARIRESLEKNLFTLYCQPIVPLNGGDETGCGIEILVRMIDEDGRMVPPGAFIPAAERYDLMTYIDRWVVEAVCRHWEQEPEIFERLDRIAINLSGLSIANDDFHRFVIDRIASVNLPWEKVCWEITETAAVNSIEKAQRLIAELAGRGCRFALDDFGSGLSSFAYLKNLPVDYLKIDGAFVRDMLTDAMDAAMVRSIADIGRALGLRTIAEFVEDKAMIAALRNAGVDFAQGYGICRPMPLHELRDWMSDANEYLLNKVG